MAVHAADEQTLDLFADLAPAVSEPEVEALDEPDEIGDRKSVV